MRGCAGAGEFCGTEIAGGKVEEGESGGAVGEVDGGEVVVLIGGEGGIEGGTGREDAGDLTADDFLRELRVLHLVADGDAIALAEEAGDVVLRSVIRDAAHGDAALFVAGGEGDLQLA